MAWRSLLHLHVLNALILIIPSISSLRNVSDIRYHFTTCGASGRIGPPLFQCEDEYRHARSPILQPENLLFGFTDSFTGGRTFRGAQGFRVPKSGLYNITVAGAAGGRGICSLGGGKGLVWRGQVDLSEEQNLLILVGQKGRGPCDVPLDVNLPLCQHPPTSADEVNTCNREWFRWLGNHIRLRSGEEVMFNYAHTGAGSGGGASMVWRQNNTTKDFNDLPIAIAGGGGGSSANLSYNALVNPQFEIPLPTAVNTIEEFYEIFVNAKNMTRDLQLSGDYVDGQRGYVPEGLFNAELRAGAGGGWSPIQTGTHFDGQLLSRGDNFANGGDDCARQLMTEYAVAVREVDGGFGGGGGQCGGGGAGGGYTGGSIFGTNVNLPGGGGYYYVDLPDSNVNELQTSMTSEADGYVDIVLANCGCAGVCEVVEEMFYCECPNETCLAPDELDCYQDTELIVSEGPIVLFSESNLMLNYRALNFNTTVSLYSIDIHLELQDETDLCMLFFTGMDSEIVLASNAVRKSTGTADSLGVINSSSNSVSSFSSDILNSSVLVTGAFLVSTGGNCSVEETQFRANVSIQRQSAPGANLTEVPQNESVIASIVAEILARDAQPLTTTEATQHHSTSTQTTSSPQRAPTLNVGAIAGIAVGGVVGFLAIILAFVVGFLCIFRRRKGLRNKLVESLHPHRSAASAVKFNTLTVVSNHVAGLPSTTFITKKQLKLGKIIGEGDFGTVYKAKLYRDEDDFPTTVAVKTLKGFFSPHHVDEMMKESKKMVYFNHPNVQTLIGICIDGGPAPYIVMPFMENGSLLSYLRKNKERVLLVETENAEHEEYEVNEVTIQLTEMCFQIAKGMEYLTNNHIIHRDLAARNCMIDKNHVVRVSDFGLSENTYMKTYFHQENHTTVPLPVKWIAPESFSYGIFSEKTDVWSFGVTCWEVFSAGKIPYPGIAPQTISQLIDKGYRMDKPENAACTDTMYGVMRQCWRATAEERPKFSELVENIESDLETMAEYLPLGVTNALYDTEPQSPKEDEHVYL